MAGRFSGGLEVDLTDEASGALEAGGSEFTRKIGAAAILNQLITTEVSAYLAAAGRAELGAARLGRGAGVAVAGLGILGLQQELVDAAERLEKSDRRLYAALREQDLELAAYFIEGKLAEVEDQRRAIDSTLDFAERVTQRWQSR